MTTARARSGTTNEFRAATFRGIGTTVTVLVARPDAVAAAEAIAREVLADLDQACSRFRDDSELATLPPGRWCSVSPMLATVIEAALRAAQLTGGIVDPTVADAMCDNGYDRDFDDLPRNPDLPAPAGRPAPGWWRVGVAVSSAQLLVPRDVHLDLGATAKALAADLIAEQVHRDTGSAVLVSLGGDVAVAGQAPPGGWRIGVGADHTVRAPGDPVVTISAGGLATSSTTRRRWRRGNAVVHHIVDPRTGRNPAPCWATVSVAAGSCVDANTASTAAIVLGPAAPDWLALRGLPARLVATSGAVTTVASWPDRSRS